MCYCRNWSIFDLVSQKVSEHWLHKLVGNNLELDYTLITLEQISLYVRILNNNLKPNLKLLNRKKFSSI